MADIVMPQLGETVTEGTITKWFKQVGDRVELDELLFEVSTDKVDSEVPSSVAGILSEIRVAEGETVDVGSILAVVGVIAAAAVAPSATPAAPPPPSDAASSVAAPSAPEPVVVTPVSPPVAPTAVAAPVASPPGPAEAPVTMPALLSEGAPAATDVRGDGDGGQDPMAKVLSPVVRRLLTEHHLDPNTIIGSGLGGRITREDVLAVIDAQRDAPSESPVPTTPPIVSAASSAAAADSGPPSVVSPPAAPSRPAVAPGPPSVAPAGVVPSAPAVAPTPGVVTSVPEAPAAPPASVAPAAAMAPSVPEAPAVPLAPAASVAPGVPARSAGVAPAVRIGPRDEVVPFNNVRRRTGDYMLASLATSPHAFIAVEVDFSNIDRVRGKAKDAFKAEEGFSLTYLPFISRAVIDAMRTYPHINATVGDGSLVVHHTVNLGIAVDLEFQGLMVPVIRDADGKRMRAIARDISDLAARARTKKLSPDDISGGTFTISNAGPFGIDLMQSIINQPQVAILSVTSVKKKPVVVELPDGGDTIAIHPMGMLGLSWDHRAFDGGYAASFLHEVRKLLEAKDWTSEL